MKKNIIAIVLVVVAIVVIGSLYTYMHNRKQATNAANVTLDATQDKALQSAVFTAVDAKTKGTWDKKLTVDRVDQSRQAASGKWLAKDSWDWIAWQQNGSWQVLVSLDGFDCKELATIPGKYTVFFYDVTYQSSGQQYCYDHAARTNP